MLSQSTFGPNTADIDRLTAAGYGAWLDDQFSKPQTLHRGYMDSIGATLPAGGSLSQNQFFESFWQQAITGDDQLRQRVTYALSQIFVVSFQDSTVSNYPRGVASYYDMLAANAFGNYRSLLDPEARADVNLASPNSGKLREPVVRLANWMRAFNATSASKRFLLGSLDDPLSSLGQTPMRAPSVFNFYRPGYVPPNTSIANAGLVSPEMQITGETSVVGYLNFMRDVVQNGTGSARDVKPDYTAELALADTPDKLLDRLNLLLMANQMSPTLRAQILAAVNSVAISSTNQTDAAMARKNRVYLAVFLDMASPEYIVQK